MSLLRMRERNEEVTQKIGVLAFCVEVCLLIIQLLVRYFVVTLLKWMVA